MRNTPSVPTLAPPGAYRRVFKDGARVLLTAQASWPRLREDAPGLRRINRYYDALAERWIKRWEGPLLARAKAAPPDAPPWSGSLTFTVTLLNEGIFSLCWDAVEEVGEPRPRRVRGGDTWALPAGLPVKLPELLPPRRWWRGQVYQEVRRQIGRQVSAGESVYYDDWPHLVSRRFSPDRFYLTDSGPTLFYPVESLAPAMEGFPTFSLAGLVSPN